MTSFKGKKMTATPREVLLIWVKAALETASGNPHPSANRSGLRLLVQDLERMAMELQASQGGQP